MSVSRRRFIGQTGWLTAVALNLRPAAWAEGAPVSKPGPPARHIIHLVADGMNLSTLSCGDQFSRLVRGRGLAWLSLGRRPETVSGFMNMRSLNSMVTDSAAASSSWGSGSRVVNGVLNVLPNGRVLNPLYSLFGEAGWRRGLVTTTEITHATPAGFASTCEKREDAEGIAQQYLQGRIDVLLGGGRKFFEAKTRKDKLDLREDYARQGYTVCDRADQLAQAPLDQRWLGLFAASHLPYTVDLLHNAEDQKNVPPLAIMTHRALRHLRQGSHFILQVEGGRVDHGAHNNDAAAALRELVAFDEALEVCLDFQRQEPGTLVVVTADHGTGNPGLNGMGSGYQASSMLFANLLGVRCSFPEMQKRLDADSTPAKIQEVLADATSLVVPEKRAALLLPFLQKKGQTLYETMNGVTQQLGQLLANYVGVGWTSGNHSSDYVPITARGPGAEHFRGLIDNTEVFPRYLDLAGIDFRNPSAPLMAESPGVAPSTEWAGNESGGPSHDLEPHWV